MEPGDEAMVCYYPSRVITLSVHPWICLFVWDTKMSALCEVCDVYLPRNRQK